MKQTTITPTLFFDKRGCREGEFSVKHSIYLGTQRMCSTGLILGNRMFNLSRKILPVKSTIQVQRQDLTYTFEEHIILSGLGGIGKLPEIM
jgi:hypothetical protein